MGQRCSSLQAPLSSLKYLSPLLKAAKRIGFLDLVVRGRTCTLVFAPSAAAAMLVASASAFARAVWTFDKWEGLMWG